MGINNIRFYRLATLLWLLILAFSSDGFGQRQISDQNIISEADNYLLVLVGQGRFSGSVLLARGDKVLMSEGYGAANLELGIPNSRKTKLFLASGTKQFTAITRFRNPG